MKFYSLHDYGFFRFVHFLAIHFMILLIFPLQISKEDFDYYLGKVLAPFANQLPDNLRKLLIENRKISEIKSKIIDLNKKKIKIEKSDKENFIKEKKEEKSNRKDDDTDDNYDDYEDEFENEEIISQINMTNAEDKKDIEKDFHKKKTVSHKTEIDNGDDDFFTFNKELAVNRIIEYRIENEIKKKKEFALWKLKKDFEVQLIEEKNVRFFIIQ